ncbi:hypothetical protein N7462_003814 [Penicillium macrosclerotiorum]|uniref:uncharacterized protein n=1 Tax=Penicillium macrosclerotiorum TaxID=303699 RepID=UPI002548DD3E|nr:uncharacterized protein N7462_003814 [Penicillium macrosclerotiorum]KAJ5689422.1 hypothetical protein N7462_003814 [Penicillium macrosclerotiorum]
MKSTTMKLPEGHGSVYKEVRFSPTATPLRRAKSVAGSTPSMNSKYQHVSSTQVPTDGIFSIDTSYIDQSRQLLQSQRVNFETERELFAQERRLWEKERALLRAKIAELESWLKSQRSQSSISGSQPPKLAFGTPQYQGTNNGLLHSAQVWEGSSPGGRPTRVFQDEDKSDNSRLSMITEGRGSNPPSLDAALSPRARAVDALGPTVSVPVPIEKLDSRLDGITLKSTALPPGVVARVITPPSPSPLETSPAPASALSVAARPDMEHRNSLKLKLSELGPPNENLVRNAGHTPMAIIEADISQRSTQEASPITEVLPCEEEEAPLAPVVTEVHQPTENAESYFPDLPDDPALKGPLGLTNDKEHDNSFLHELDQKLLDQAKRILSSSVESVDPNEPDPELPHQSEQEPEIKFRNATNFGTAFGLSSFGKF